MGEIFPLRTWTTSDDSCWLAIGVGDTLDSFDVMAKSLKLLQTACLSLQAPTQLPLLEEAAFQWWHSFDELGERELSLSIPRFPSRTKMIRFFAQSSNTPIPPQRSSYWLTLSLISPRRLNRIHLIGIQPTFISSGSRKEVPQQLN